MRSRGNREARTFKLVRLEKILIRGVNWLGDSIMSTPALCRLREAHPEAHIAILTPEKLADLWQHHPAIDAVLTFSKGEHPARIAGRLRAEKFQVGVVLPYSFRSALEVWAARIPQRIGYGERGRAWLLTQPLAPHPGYIRMRQRSVKEVQQLVRSDARPKQMSLSAESHHSYRYLHLMAVLGACPEPMSPQIRVTAAEVGLVAERFGLLLDQAERPLFGLNPGGEYGPAKRWPAERFIAAASRIYRQTRCRWLLFGSKADVEIANQIAAGI